MCAAHYVREMIKIVVAQICKEHSFQSIQESALDTLCDVLQKYVEEIGYRSHLKAELACRTECNFNDVRDVLNGLGVSLDDLYTFASFEHDLPFPKPVPSFPLKKSSSSIKNEILTISPTQNGKAEETSPLPPHIPKHMPPFPEPHTYVHTSLVSEERISDARLIRKRKSKEKRQVETSLAKLNEKLGNKPIINYDTARKTRGNPFLNPAKIRTKESKTESKESTSTAAKVTPTPLQKGIQRKDTSNNKIMFDENDENKKVYSELEESERVKKRQRAEQILSLPYDLDVVDQELPIKPGAGPIVEKL